MLLRFTKVSVGVGLLLVLWVVGVMRHNDRRAWVGNASGPPGPVRILRFYASVGTLTVGQTAQLCYGVENAKSVRISPILQTVYPAASRCLEIVPEHTTHYMILAEGFDGNVATRSFTLPVERPPAVPSQAVNFAEAIPPRR